jgi:uncharacterized protein YqiB (DUF1249 family)
MFRVGVTLLERGLYIVVLIINQETNQELITQILPSLSVRRYHGATEVQVFSSASISIPSVVGYSLGP